MARATHVQILLAARNGARYLPEQLASFEDQSHRDWSLLAGDDGSDDDTPQLLERAAGHPPLQGPGRGSGAHFLTLLAAADRTCAVAFSDQDDVWLPDKLARAMTALAEGGAGPAAYASRSLYCDAALRVLGPSPEPARGPSFGNALVQNILPGHSLVLSPDAADLLRATVPAALANGVPFHDWWAYQMLTGAGVRIVFDPEPGVLYRQHDGNLQGAAGGLRAGLTRAAQALGRHYSGWIDANLAALGASRDLLTGPARDTLDAFEAARKGPAGARFRAFRAAGILRQSPAGDRALAALAWAGRV